VVGIQLIDILIGSIYIVRVNWSFFSGVYFLTANWSPFFWRRQLSKVLVLGSPYGDIPQHETRTARFLCRVPPINPCPAGKAEKKVKPPASAEAHHLSLNSRLPVSCEILVDFLTRQVS
jgi:hypothetical protein